MVPDILLRCPLQVTLFNFQPDRVELMREGQLHEITYTSLHVARLVRAEKLLPWRKREPLSKMRDRFAPATTENVQAQDFPHQSALGRDFNFWAFHMHFSSQEVFFPGFLSLLDNVYLFCFQTKTNKKHNTTSPPPNTLSGLLGWF